MARNRDYWNALEAHIRSDPHGLFGMSSTVGANELRRLAPLIARYAKIHKDRDATIKYIVRKLSALRDKGFIEALGPPARAGICELITPIWSWIDWSPIEAKELISAGEQDEQP
jgi:hypothetical protein